MAKKRGHELLDWLKSRRWVIFHSKTILRVILQDCNLSEIVFRKFITLIKYRVRCVLLLYIWDWLVVMFWIKQRPTKSNYGKCLTWYESALNYWIFSLSRNGSWQRESYMSRGQWESWDTFENWSRVLLITSPWLKVYNLSCGLILVSVPFQLKLVMLVSSMSSQLLA